MAVSRTWGWACGWIALVVAACSGAPGSTAASTVAPVANPCAAGLTPLAPDAPARVAWPGPVPPLDEDGAWCSVTGDTLIVSHAVDASRGVDDRYVRHFGEHGYTVDGTPGGQPPRTDAGVSHTLTQGDTHWRLTFTPRGADRVDVRVEPAL